MPWNQITPRGQIKVPQRPGSASAALRPPSSEETRRFRPIQFFQDILSELRKAVWPSREETIRLTYVVIAVSALVGALLGAFDFGLGKTLTEYVILGKEFP